MRKLTDVGTTKIEFSQAYSLSEIDMLKDDMKWSWEMRDIKIKKWDQTEAGTTLVMGTPIMYYLLSATIAGQYVIDDNMNIFKGNIYGHDFTINYFGGSE